MDKVEYKIRADEIRALIGEGRFAEAVKIADTIDWKRVKSINMLCTISDLYKINRRYTESKDVLLMAYDRHPTSRPIVYSLCELAIKMGEFVQAVEYYKEFVRIAPRDTGRYILQYKLYEAQEVSLEERIAVLEEFKKHDYRERWAYELAYLYHRVGLTTECIEECDEMFLWFGEGRYVMKALELKALHEPLSPEQQDRYTRYKQSHGGMVDASIVNEKDEVGKDETRTVEIKQPTKEMPPVTDEVIASYNMGAAAQEIPAEDLGQTREFEEIVYPHISEIKEPSVDVSTFNTMNLQESLAQSLREALSEDDGEDEEDTKVFDPIKQHTADVATGIGVQPITEEIYEVSEETDSDEMDTEEDIQEAEEAENSDIITDTTEEIDEAESLEDTEEIHFSDISEALEEQAASLDEALEEEVREKEASANGMQEVFFETRPQMGIEIKYGGNGPILGEEKISEAPIEPAIMAQAMDTEEEVTDEVEEKEQNPVIQPFRTITYEQKPLEEEVPGAVIHPNASYQMHSHFENMLAQEPDGQISLAVEPEPAVEKQITGQISIAEYLENWEQFKKDQQQKQLERVKKRVADETGDMFSEFDEKTKAGLQEKIEKAITDAIKKDRSERYSGRNDWSVKREDKINAAIDEVIEQDGAVPRSVEDYVPEEVDEETEDLEAVSTMTQEMPVAEPIDMDEESTDTEEDTEEAVEATEAAQDSEPEDDVESQQPSEEAEKSSEEPDHEDDEDEEDDEEEEKDKSKPEAPSKPEKAPTAAADSKKEEKPDQRKKHHIGNRELEERVRTMTPEEKELFGPYIHHKKSRRQIINAIDNLSMDAFSGNAIVTGEEGAGTVNLAKGLIKAMQASDSNFSGKVAKITANVLNKKSTASIFDKLANGALIIQRAADLEEDTVKELLKILQEENKGLVIVMEDTREDMDRFLEKNPSLKQSFNVRVDIEALDDDSLVAYARQYALEKEYAIDNLGILALHTRISERQTLDHDVTVAEVKDIVDDAIYFAEKKTVGHLVDVLVRKRYDENDMIILREKDFMHD
ncbi:MAG: hypothetical protein IJU77_10050 [Butyrivibrio sp.]|nr:hypothetical protein [Butyrivibrio sp.]